MEFGLDKVYERCTFQRIIRWNLFLIGRLSISFSLNLTYCACMFGAACNPAFAVDVSTQNGDSEQTTIPADEHWTPSVFRQ